MSQNPPKKTLSEFGPTPIAIAKRFYEAYLENSNGLNFRGDPCPCWKELDDDVKITNPNLIDAFQVGEHYLVEFRKA